MAYIESSLMMFQGKSHKLFNARIPDETEKEVIGNHTMICKNGEVIWEILGRKGRQVVIPVSRYSNSWNQFTITMDIDKNTYTIQGSVGQVSRGGFTVNDNGIMLDTGTNRLWKNISVNGAVFYDPNLQMNLTSGGSVFGNGDSFYGLNNGNRLLKLTIDERGFVEDEEVVEEFSVPCSLAYNGKYKGFDYCLLYMNYKYYEFNLKTKDLILTGIPYPFPLTKWLTDGKFAFINGDNATKAYYLNITSDFVTTEKIYIGLQSEMRNPYLHCRYPYVYVWTTINESNDNLDIFYIIKINIVSGERQTIFPKTLKIGDVTFYVKKADENNSPQAPYIRLWNPNSTHNIFWDYNEYFDDGKMKDDLAGGYGAILVNMGGGRYNYYAVYMDNLELQPSEHNQTVFICDF